MGTILLQPHGHKPYSLLHTRRFLPFRRAVRQYQFTYCRRLAPSSSTAFLSFAVRFRMKNVAAVVLPPAQQLFSPFSPACPWPIFSAH